MHSEKRIRKPPIPFPLPDPKSYRKDKPLEKKRKLSAVEYEPLPVLPKYNPLEDTLLLYGNIALVQTNEGFFTDLSLLNQFHAYRNIEVTNHRNQKLISINVERRSDARFPRWKNAARKMIKSKDLDVKRWGKTIKAFSISYEKKIIENWKKMSKLVAENDQNKIEALIVANQQKKIELFEKYACVQARSHFKGYENHLVQLTFNEKILKILGYTVETFASIVVNEGLPQMFPLHSQINSKFIQDSLENCFRADSESNLTTGFQTTLLTKSGYERNVKIQVHIAMFYENMNYGSDTFYFIIDNDPSNLQLQQQEDLKINQDFMKLMLDRENEISQFLSAYYNYSTTLMYSNLHKTCKIKELDTSILCKILE